VLPGSDFRIMAEKQERNLNDGRILLIEAVARKI
jgi:hypothetical protein